MSRVGSSPINIDSAVKVDLQGSSINISGKHGKFTHTIPMELEVSLNDSIMTVKPKKMTKKSRSLWGLTTRLLQNYVKGANEGFQKTLEMTGVGFRSSTDSKILTLVLGFSHQILYVIPEGITIKCVKPTTIEIFGSDKQKVGQVAADIRALRKPEPYKGKGIRYNDEVIRRKEGKKK